MARPRNKPDPSVHERIDFNKRTLHFQGTTLPPFPFPAAEMSMADFLAFAKRARGAAENFPIPAAPSGVDSSTAGA